MLRRVRRWTTAPDSLSSRSLGEPGVVPAPGPILRAGISVGRVFRRAPRPPTLRRGESGRQGEPGGAQAVVADRNVRMVAPRTGPNRLSGTTWGTVQAQSGVSEILRPCRNARPA